MKDDFKIFLLVVAIFCWGLAWFFIGGTCTCTTTRGGFSMDIAPVFSVAGVLLLLLALYLTFRDRQLMRLKLAAVILYCIALYWLGQYAMSSSRQSIQDATDLYDAEPPNIITLSIYYCTCAFLLIGGIFGLGYYYTDNDKRLE